MFHVSEEPVLDEFYWLFEKVSHTGLEHVGTILFWWSGQPNDKPLDTPNWTTSIPNQRLWAASDQGQGIMIPK